MMSDGSGDVPMDRLGEGQGKTKRVGVSASCSVTKMINVLGHNILYASSQLLHRYPRNLISDLFHRSKMGSKIKKLRE